jgi:hypothetical protein
MIRLGIREGLVFQVAGIRDGFFCTHPGILNGDALLCHNSSQFSGKAESFVIFIHTQQRL